MHRRTLAQTERCTNALHTVQDYENLFDVLGKYKSVKYGGFFLAMMKMLLFMSATAIHPQIGILVGTGPGHNYTGHNYAGHNHVGQHCIGPAD